MAGNANSGRRPSLARSIADLRSELGCLRGLIRELAQAHRHEGRTIARGYSQLDEIQRAIDELMANPDMPRVTLHAVSSPPHDLEAA